MTFKVVVCLAIAIAGVLLMAIGEKSKTKKGVIGMVVGMVLVTSTALYVIYEKLNSEVKHYASIQNVISNELKIKPTEFNISNIRSNIYEVATKTATYKAYFNENEKLFKLDRLNYVESIPTSGLDRYVNKKGSSEKEQVKGLIAQKLDMNPNQLEINELDYSSYEVVTKTETYKAYVKEGMLFKLDKIKDVETVK
ncbi:MULTISPECIES: hypothetical protein [Bacillus]|uniref:Uncharacterized protein n=2 Tax=Bacillus thuringiensis TaxID=1428 RepID=A0AAP4Q615_BACTU|nr:MULTISPECIES: hypothetical protein [Bacillus]MEC0046428.1 hypothetical protein [Bacillus cereus]AFV21793.1 hypothetical protein BTB_502p04880 [Bacillus thuringiensis Bt407]EEM25180.1 hypothetical protein bthur0002_58220 [Bacillus thuringiensis Bt407]ERI01030.1 hypothetical protein BTCBT_002585 [Bacillus thuringiensis T01-328]MBN6707792.1 hypothetical protein [Bacillus thuringiensis]